MIAYTAAYMAAINALDIGGWMVVTAPGRDPAERPVWVTAATLRGYPGSTVSAEARLQGEALALCCEKAGLRETATLLRGEMVKAFGAPTLPPPSREVAA